MSNSNAHAAGAWVVRQMPLLLLVAYASLSLLPLYLMFVSSLVPIGGELNIAKLPWFPFNPSLENLWGFNARLGGGLPRFMLNSLIVSTVPTASSVLFGCMAGYALAKLDFPGRTLLFWVVVVTMTVPYFVILIPLYELVWSYDWIDTWQALLVPLMAGVAPVFLARQFLVTLPGTLLEAARIDGCGELGIFFRIVLPIARPLLGVLGCMLFVVAWSEYFWAYLVINSRDLYTIQMAIVAILGVDSGYAGDLDYGEIMAGALVASLPVLILFLAVQKQFIRGLTVGAVKG